eukprot:Skav220933  [mRNA]  locus=scaffold3184:234390:234707:+ [translate_table: standard]
MIHGADDFMASKQQKLQIRFWSRLVMRRKGSPVDEDSPLDQSFLNAVKDHPESFELFVKSLREATYPDGAEPGDAHGILTPESLDDSKEWDSVTKLGTSATIISL